MSFLTKILGNPDNKFFKSANILVGEINDLEAKLKGFSDSELTAQTKKFKDKLKEGHTLDDLLVEAFATVREAAKRTLKQRHFDVQLLGGIALHKGRISEMKTGEGKTLVATLAAYLNALDGKGVHIITVNDYLSRRDAVWMGQIYDILDLTVACVNHETSYIYDPASTQSQENENELDKKRDETGGFHVVHEFLRPCSRKEAYRADILYGTNNEFGFDYLRDNIAHTQEQTVQRGHNFAVIDEIDSVLIDEARTPLIISAPVEDSQDFYITFSRIAGNLRENDDYIIDEKLKAISLTEPGIEHAEKMLGVNDIYTEKGIKYVHHLETAVRAKAIFERDRDYVVKDGNIIIVDEFTGRLMPGRRWSEGLHQAVEAKEGVQIQKESRTFASITFQNYFRMYNKLSGMTGTAVTSAEEFYKVYNLETTVIPTNKPIARKDYPDLVFQTENGRVQALARRVKELHEKGQPVLVGTVSIQKNEYVSKILDREGVSHKVLNAKQHEQEGEIIAQAGKKGKVTIATNMAGRGVDIVLGGVPYDEKKANEVKELGGLFVLGTERHDARRIDNQLRGRSGRQGDPGETQFYLSLEDDLMRVFGSDRIKSMMEKFGIPEDQPIENKIVSKAIESAQSKIEGFNFDARKQVLEYDDVMNHQRNIIYKRRKKILFGDNNFVMDALKNIFEKLDIGADFLDKKRQEMGDEAFFNTQRRLMLQVIDMLWVEHLEIMDYMRSSVRLRAYGQRNPLVEYKNEGLRLFRQLEASIDHTISEQALKIGTQIKMDQQRMFEVHKSGALIDAQQTGSSQAGVRNKKVGRNDPCPCGSGKKYKKCCGS